MNKTEELKTLRNLIKTYTNSDGTNIDSDEIKAEAVKWVKRLEKSAKEYDKEDCTNYWFRGKAEMLKEFFDIKDEELKQGDEE